MPGNCVIISITSPGLITSPEKTASAGLLSRTKGFTLQSRVELFGVVYVTNFHPDSKYFKVFCDNPNRKVSVNSSNESPTSFISRAVAALIIPVSAKIFKDSINAPAGNSSPGGFKLLQSSQGRSVGLVIARSRALGSRSNFSTPIITPFLEGRSHRSRSNAFCVPWSPHW